MMIPNGVPFGSLYDWNVVAACVLRVHAGAKGIGRNGFAQGETAGGGSGTLGASRARAAYCAQSERKPRVHIQRKIMVYEKRYYVHKKCVLSLFQ